MNKRILNTRIDFADYDTLLSLIFENVEKGKKLTLTYANSHICISAAKDCLLHDCLEKFDIVHRDGIAVHKACRFLYPFEYGLARMNGTDLYRRLFTCGRAFSCFVLGGPPDSPELLRKNFGGHVDVRGFIHKPSGTDADIEKINNSNAGILFVALGTSAQEKWIILNRDRVNVPVIIATGSGIDFLTGKKRRAPLFMRKLGMEWLYRLFSEPVRLWKRYLVMNPFFIFKVIQQKLKLTEKQGNT
ncbi:MAG: WecB/TagA/CpsF family glycosyltransferase [Bacteroidetes bacterium]|nr:WecB/TagA/CpsF family glycosyltransferase [Bacteroidota bacterium]